MENKTPIKDHSEHRNIYLKTTMTYGLLTGLALIVYTLLMYATNNLLDQSFILNIINYLILIVGIVAGIRYYRDQILGGYILYGRALGYGVLMCVFAGIVIGVFTYLLYAVIDPGLMEESIRLMQEEMLNRGMSERQVELMTEAQRTIRSPFMMLLGSIFMYGLLGLVFSLVISAFLQKEKPTNDQSNTKA